MARYSKLLAVSAVVILVNAVAYAGGAVGNVVEVLGTVPEIKNTPVAAHPKYSGPVTPVDSEPRGL